MRPGFESPSASGQPATRMCRFLGPCTPSTRSSSMSLVADGPEMKVCGRPGSSRAMACGTGRTWSARDDQVEVGDEGAPAALAGAAVEDDRPGLGDGGRARGDHGRAPCRVAGGQPRVGAKDFCLAERPGRLGVGRFRPGWPASAAGRLVGGSSSGTRTGPTAARTRAMVAGSSASWCAGRGRGSRRGARRTAPRCAASAFVVRAP